MSTGAKADRNVVRFGGRRTRGGYLFEVTGGRLCLDLANTKDQRRREHPRELLREYRDVADWGVQAGALSRLERRGLLEHAARHPAGADRALGRLVDAREAIFELFSAVARRRPIPPGPLATLNALVATASSKRELVEAPGRFRWVWRQTGAADLDRALWAAVLSATQLLTSESLARVRQCEGTGCAWLFVDTSKNSTRRWCDMSVCGNRAKARRHRSRLRTASPS